MDEVMESGRGQPVRVSTEPGDVPWMSRTPWGAIVAGALAGFGAMILMGTLGAAIGITAGTIAVSNAEGSLRETADRASSVAQIWMVVWTLLTAIVVGLVGGWALNRTARAERNYFAFTFGTVTWALGVLLALLVVVPGGAGLVAGAGNTASAAMMNRPGMYARERTAPPREPGAAPSVTEPNKADVENAGAMATGAAWVLFASQIISLCSTILAAGWRRPMRPKIKTEIRLRPAPTA